MTDLFFFILINLINCCFVFLHHPEKVLTSVTIENVKLHFTDIEVPESKFKISPAISTSRVNCFRLR